MITRYYKRTYIIVLALLLTVMMVMLLSLPTQAKTYRECKTYSLTGILRKRTYNHSGSGLKLTGYTLSLSKKIKISSTRYDTFKGKELDINTNRLSAKKYAKLKKWVGKKVRVKGTLMIPDYGGWWYTGGIILASKISK